MEQYLFFLINLAKRCERLLAQGPRLPMLELVFHHRLKPRSSFNLSYNFADTYFLHITDYNK